MTLPPQGARVPPVPPVPPLVSEFDAFGPWIDEVLSPADVPRLYADFPIDFGTALRVLKFPRGISRRDALPTMDLYDYLVVAEPRELTVLTRRERGYARSTLAYDQIAAIVDGVTMLSGELRILTLSGDSFTLPYNATSQKIVASLVDLMRGLARPERAGSLRSSAAGIARAQSIAPLGMDSLGRPDAVLVSLLGELLAREPGIRAVAAHGRSGVRVRAGGMARLAHLLRPAVLQGVVVCVGSTELQILSRRDWIARGGAPVMSYARTVVPLALIDSVGHSEHPAYEGATLLTLHVGRARVEMVVPAGSRAEGVLRGRVAG
jgi:hypothetical protein